jgi:hypothetical protein
MTETEYWTEFQLIQNEVATAMESFYAHQEINIYATEDPAVLRGLQDAAFFWVTVRHGLLTTFFITLGRLFDEAGSARSIHKLLRDTAAHPEFFSREALAERKRQSSGEAEPAWLTDFIKDIWQPEAADLRALRLALRPSIQKYQAFYEPIRDKVFAHREVMDGAAVSALFSKAIIGEIEDVLKALHELTSAIFQLYQNGRKLTVDERENGHRQHTELIRSTARRALSRIKRYE